MAVQIKTATRVVPMIYGYSTPEIERHNGWTKIGYTEQDVDTRLQQQTHTADVQYREEWRGKAEFDDGSGEIFTDKDFHAYLRRQKVEYIKKTEWFHLDGPKSKAMFYDFRENRGILAQNDDVIPYKLREEQERAVTLALDYSRLHENGEFLWNAKPRFGKTLAAYDLCVRLEAQNVLIVTNRPAIANSWYDDYARFFGPQSGYYFVSHVDALKEKRFCYDREFFVKSLLGKDDARCIEFVSLQDLKGSRNFGGSFDKLNEVANLTWDILIIDEAHEGVDTYRSDVAFDHIKRKFTLHLSGTPFKALASDKFPENAIFNWTYADEQKAKASWNGEEENPYQNLPRLNLFTYQMSEIVREELQQGIEIEGETTEYAFDLNEFFAVKGERFVHDASVDRFLDALSEQMKFPFSTPELREELRHTFWFLNRVDSARALAKKLAAHPVFGEYEIILAAGDGKLDEDDETQKSFDRVTEAIRTHAKTITLSVGQLTTGVTIPEWTAVLMLSNVKSPALYMQAAFRAQNPCLFHYGTEHLRKQNAYVFDFDPARTLDIFEQFANDLSADTSAGRGDSEQRKEHVRELLNFFPVIGEDEDGEMVELDAEKVLTIPRKLKSQEVVRRGFMSNYLFQNISNIFGAPQEVIDIITSFDPVKEPKTHAELKPVSPEDLALDENGEVQLPDALVVGVTQDVFGEKKFEEIHSYLSETIESLAPPTPDLAAEQRERLKQAFHTQAVQPIVAAAQDSYGTELRPAERKRLERRLREEANHHLDRLYDDYTIEQNRAEAARDEQYSRATTETERRQADEEFTRRTKQAAQNLQDELTTLASDFVRQSEEDIVRTVETGRRETEKRTVEDAVRDHLRGFARTIPSFLMAYGSEEVCLESFDRIIPNRVFVEVTGITLDQFRFLRDGGDYTDETTGEVRHFGGHLFDPVVFDDSVREFLRLRERLSDYFDDEQTEDIFDYIPPQKTNQIFTPKRIVRQMADLLEQENPGCFDNPEHTFLDPYMKSGLYIAEIVKRLFNSPRLRAAYPDGTERLRHIFAHQVYGLAPTEIIHRIVLSFVLGFDTQGNIQNHHLVQFDALPYAKEGTLNKKLDEVFGGEYSGGASEKE